MFHHVQRLTRTLKKNHVDHFRAANALLNCIYHCNDEDHENLLTALKEGTLSGKCSDDETSELKSTKTFKQRCDRHLRKEMRPPNILCSMLDDWFDQFKCSSSDNKRPARGRKDPVSGDTLFSCETKGTVEECKKKSMHLQDPLPLDEMCDVMHPNPNAPHQLKECLSRRGESCLESFHLMLAHFGNCGMRTSLADNLNLTGAARHNLSMRTKRRLIDLTLENTEARRKTPAAHESVITFFNDAELLHVNQIAIQAGTSPHNLPFKCVEDLPADNGERFFSEHLTHMRQNRPRHDVNCRCLCDECGVTAAVLPQQSKDQQDQTDHTTMKEIGEEVGAMPPANEINNSANQQLMNVLAPETQINNKRTQQHQQQPTQQRQVQQHMQQQLQQCHQQPHPSVAHQWANHEPVNMLCCSPMTQQLPHHPPQCTPWIVTQHMTAAGTAFCCSRCRSWHNRVGRRGRPPHDGHCRLQWATMN